jgi:hypothetical protein
MCVEVHFKIEFHVEIRLSHSHICISSDRVYMYNRVQIVRCTTELECTEYVTYTITGLEKKGIFTEKKCSVHFGDIYLRICS